MEHARFVGLDIHKERISVAEAESGRSGAVEYHGEIANDPAAIRKLRDRLGRSGNPLAFCYEGRCRFTLQCVFLTSCCSGHYTGSRRARRSSGPARPYIVRLKAFRRLICPSVWPLLQGSVIAFCTASMSLCSVRAKRCIAYRPEHWASFSQMPSLLTALLLSMPLNLIASRRIAANSGQSFFVASIFAA